MARIVTNVQPAARDSTGTSPCRYRTTHDASAGESPVGELREGPDEFGGLVVVVESGLGLPGVRVEPAGHVVHLPTLLTNRFPGPKDADARPFDTGLSVRDIRRFDNSNCRTHYTGAVRDAVYALGRAIETGGSYTGELPEQYPSTGHPERETDRSVVRPNNSRCRYCPHCCV